MRETLRDWKRDWIEANGETEGLEVVISDNSIDESLPYIYEGSFTDIPEDLINRTVIKCGMIIGSSIKERNGAYSLTIN